MLLTWYWLMETEDIFHCRGRNWSETWEMIRISYLITNSRIGELLIYPMGMSSCYEGWVRLLWIFRILNPLFITSGIVLAYRLGTGIWGITGRWTWLVTLLLMLLCLAWRYDAFWLCGNMNWLYSSVLMLGYLILLEPVYKGTLTMPFGRFCGMFVLLLILGMVNETTPLLVGAASFFPLLYWSVKKRRVPSWHFWILGVVFLLSFAVFILAPGHAERASTSDWKLDFHTLIFKSLLSSMWIHFLYFTYLRDIIILLVIACACRFLKIDIQRRRLLLLILAFLILWLPLMAAPFWGAPRSFAPMNLILLAVYANIFNQIIPKLNNTKKVALVLFITAITSTMFVPLFASAKLRYDFYADIQSKAQRVIRSGGDTLILHKEDLILERNIVRCDYLPNSIFQKRVFIKYPPITFISEKEWAESPALERRHDIVFPYEYPKLKAKGIYVHSGDEQRNHELARLFGLKSIICIRK